MRDMRAPIRRKKVCMRAIVKTVRGRRRSSVRVHKALDGRCGCEATIPDTLRLAMMERSTGGCHVRRGHRHILDLRHPKCGARVPTRPPRKKFEPTFSQKAPIANNLPYAHPEVPPQTTHFRETNKNTQCVVYRDSRASGPSRSPRHPRRRSASSRLRARLPSAARPAAARTTSSSGRRCWRR